jgi:preprotein translocase subunit SecD
MYNRAMPDALQPAPPVGPELAKTRRNMGLLALAVAWAAILAMFFFWHEFGSKVSVQLALMAVGALAMFVVAAKLLRSSRTR